MGLQVAQNVLHTLERAEPKIGFGWLIGLVTPAATHVLSVAKDDDVSLDALGDLVAVDESQMARSLGANTEMSLPFALQWSFFLDFSGSMLAEHIVCL